jgi:tetratricopeptide (TPR) repeat protein
MRVRRVHPTCTVFFVCLAWLAAPCAPAYEAHRDAPGPDGAPDGASEAAGARPVAAIAGDPAAIREAVALDAAGDTAGAVARLQSAIRETPDVPRLWEVLGLLHWKAGRPDEALVLWAHYSAAVGTLPQPHVWIGELHAARNELRPALESFDRALALAPADTETLFQRTRVHRWLGHIAEAAATMRELAARHPDRADFRRELAAALLANREYDEAAGLWARVRLDRPGDIDAEMREIASRAYATGDDGAVRDATTHLERHPGTLLALYALTDVAESRGRREEALGYLKQILAVEKDPGKKARAAFRASALVSGLHELQPDRFPVREAVDLVRGYLGTQPYDVDVRLLLGELYIEDRNWSEARTTFETALRECNPQNLRACRGLFEVCVASDQLAEARHWLARVRDFNPADPYLTYLEARMETTFGRFNAALACLDRLERAGASGAAAVLLYHGLGESDWTSVPSVRLVREHVETLRAAGYRFVSAHDLPAVLGSMEVPEDLSRHVPWRIACVTWDDARRDAMKYGTPLGRDLNVPMTMHVPVGYVAENHPFIAGWETLRACMDNGTWHFGSHAYDGHDPRPASADGSIVHPLANRLWVSEAARQETDQEFRARLIREYGDSRKAIVRELKRPQDADVFAYPFGDIGQLSHCNVSNAPAINLEIAARYYTVGFIQSRFGHAVRGDNPLLFQRTEPHRCESGSNLLSRLLAAHPVFLARATRVEIAVMADKPYLANEMLALLERDGYPAERLDPLKAKVRRMFGGSLFSWPFWRKPPAASDDPAPANGSASPAASPSKPDAAAPAGTPPAPRPPPGRPPPAGVGGPEPGEELRREAGRAF